MSKFRKISRQATGLGVATFVALSSWSVIGTAQEATPAAKAAAPAVKRAPGAAAPVAAEKKAAAEVKKAKAKAKANAATPTLPAQAAEAKADAKAKKLDRKAGEDKASKESDADNKGATAKRRKLQKVSREEAVEHYRKAQQALAQIERPQDPKSEAAVEARKARREAMRELRRARDEILRSHNTARRSFQKRDPEEVEALRKKVAKRTAKLRKDRKDRAKTNREKLAKIVGEDPLHPSVREELRSHAWRLARLNQLVYLAELDKKEKLGEKAKELIEKENESHDRRLKALLAKPEVKNYKPPAQGKKAPPLKARPAIPSKLPAGHPAIPSTPPKAAPTSAPKPSGDKP